LKEAGANFHGVRPLEARVVIDNKLITGQNQFSASDYGIALYHAMTGQTPVMTI